MNQQHSIESIAAAGAANVEAMRSLASASIKAAERLVSLNLGFARNSLRLGADFKPASPADWQKIVAQQTTGFQKTSEEAAEYFRGVYDISTEAHADMTEALSSHMDEVGDSFTAFLDVVAKTAPGSERAVDALKTAFTDNWTNYLRMMKSAAQQAAPEPAPKRGRRSN